MDAKSRLYGPVVCETPPSKNEGETPREPTHGRITVSPSVTEMSVGGARMMTSLLPKEVPARKVCYISIREREGGRKREREREREGERERGEGREREREREGERERDREREFLKTYDCK